MNIVIHSSLSSKFKHSQTFCYSYIASKGGNIIYLSSSGPHRGVWGHAPPGKFIYIWCSETPSESISSLKRAVLLVFIQQTWLNLHTRMKLAAQNHHLVATMYSCLSQALVTKSWGGTCPRCPHGSYTYVSRVDS